MSRICVFVVGVAAVSAAVAACTSPLERAPLSGDDASGTSACSRVTDCYLLAPARAFDGWTVDVRVEPSAVGPIRFSIARVRRARPSDARPWIRHELVFDNRGERTITFADTRRSTMIGPPERRALLAADEGCGYGLATPRSPIEPGACARYLDILTLRPSASRDRTVTLFKGLRGLDRLAPGTYVFRKPIRFRAGRGTASEGTGTAAVVRIVYELERASGSG